MNSSRTKTIARFLQLFWAYFIGIGAVVGAVMMFVDPSGRMWDMDALLVMLRDRLAFAQPLLVDFIPSGLLLLAVNGITNFTSAALIHRRSRYGALSGIVCGAILTAWILLEFYVWGAAGLSVIYLIFALCQAGNALWWMLLVKGDAQHKGSAANAE